MLLRNFPPEVLQQSVLAFLRAELLRQTSYLELGEREGERERGVGAAAGTAGPAGGWSLLPIGDQSVAWCRVSIAEVCCLTVFILLRTVWVVPQPPLWSTSVCLQAPPWWEEKKKERKKVWQASSALNERQINVGPGRLSSARRGPINALQATTQPRHLVAAQAQWQQASSQRDHHRDEHKPVARLRSLTHR